MEDVIVFGVTVLLFLNLSDSVKFRINIITSSRVMTIFVDTERPEIRKLELHSSEFCSIFEKLEKLGVPNLARMSLMKSC